MPNMQFSVSASAILLIALIRGHRQVRMQKSGSARRQGAVREDMVTPPTARRLASEGFSWEPEIGDWCTVLGAVYVGEAQVGLWLVAAIYPQTGLLGLMDATGQWPSTQVPQRDCLWLPTIGKLKAWLRANGYHVATGETSAALLGATSPTSRHVCRLTRADTAMPLDGDGISESEALADAILRLLGTQTADSSRIGW